MRHPDGAGRRRGRRLTLNGGLVLAAVLVHRGDLTDEGQRNSALDVTLRC